MPDTEHGSPERLPRIAELTERVEWFIVLRWLAVAGILLAVPVGKYMVKFEGMAVDRLLLLAAVLFLLNCAYILAARVIHRHDKNGMPNVRAVGIFAYVQITLDLIILTALLHFTGGIRNPFSFYYVFHVVIAAILLRKLNAYVIAGAGFLLFSAMGLLEYCNIWQRHPLWDDGSGYSGEMLVMALAAVGSTLFIAAYMTTTIMAHLQKREEELEQALWNVQSLEATRRRFLMLVSHEMKSPIAAIQSILDAMQTTMSDCIGEQGSKMLTRAGERAQSLLALTRDLLTLSRQQSPETEKDAGEPVDIAELTRKNTEFYRTQAEEKKLKLIEGYPTDRFTVLGDPDSLNLVIGNLISNAIRYTPEGGQVRVEWKLDAPHAVLTVADTGIGIPESEMPNIFKEFFRAHNAKNFTASGTGLGLAITRNIVERAGGSISVKSSESKGTTFIVKLPISKNS